MARAEGASAAAGRRRRHAEIIDAAAAVFSERGYHGASTREIAERVGMQQGSLYYHFRSKEAALEEVCRLGVADFVQGLRAIVDDGDNVEAKLARAVANHLEPLRHRRHYVRTFLFSRHDLPRELRGEVWALTREYESLLEGLFHRGIAERRLRPDLDSRLAMQAFIGMCNAAAVSHRPDRAQPLDAYIAAFADIVLRGVVR